MQLYYFYKISCLNSNVTDCYIGSTIDFKRRYINHKSDCDNKNKNNYNLKIYQTIRLNGGFNNWIMHPIDILESDDYISIRKKETELMELHKSTLNINNAYTDVKEYTREYNREYRYNNKDKINQYAKQKFNCECGGKYIHQHKTRHLRSIKHQQFICQEIN